MATSVPHGFSTSSLERKLKDLNSTLQSIQGTSLWIIHHRKNAKTIISLWYKEMQKGGVKVQSNHKLVAVLVQCNSSGSLLWKVFFFGVQVDCNLTAYIPLFGAPQH